MASIGESGGANAGGGEANREGTSSSAGEQAPIPEISVEDLTQVEWQDALAEKAPVLVRGRPCYQLADAASANGDSRAASVFEALGHACSLRLRLDDSTAPFVPSVVMGQSHSASINQISEATARAFGSTAATVQDAVLRARLGDIAWVRVRDHQAARIAAQAYVEVADQYSDPDQWPEMVIQLERALQLALHLGRKVDLAKGVRAKIRALLDGSSPDGDGFRAAKLLSLLLRYRSDDPESLSTRSGGFAEQAMIAEDYARAREYWDLAADFASLAKDDDRRREALTHLAESFIAEAHTALRQPRVGPLLASNHITRAIEVLRRMGGAKDRIDELHAWLIEVQRDVPDQLLPITSAVDLTDVAEAAEQLVSGRTPELALLQLALLPVIQDVGRLRERVEKQAKDFLFMSLFPKQAIDIDGKTIARQPSIGSSDPEERELAIHIEMVSQASLQYQAVGQGVVRPARDAIMREHDLRAIDLLGITSQNPLVPEGREMLVAEGLHAGFSGDMTKAVHVLLPQLEDSLRTLLERQGIVASTLDDELLQEERNLNRVLREQAVERWLGQDLVFAMKALFIEKFGLNLRNRMAHGLLPYHAFFGGEALSAWWLTYRYYMQPIMKAVARAQQGPPASPDAAATDSP